MKWTNDPLDPDNEHQLADFFNEFETVVEKRTYRVHQKMKSCSMASHLRLIAVFIVYYRYYVPSETDEGCGKKGIADGFFKQGVLLSLSAIRHKQCSPKVIALVE